jgi:hypothetical protein
MFGTRLWGISKDLKPLVLLRVAATCWSLWLCRIDLVFEKKNLQPQLESQTLVIPSLFSSLPGHIGGQSNRRIVIGVPDSLSLL